MPDDITLTREFSARGYAGTELARMLRDGSLIRVRRGAYAQPVPADEDRVDQHVRLVHATVRQSAGEGVVSHLSAAAIHGLPVWNHLLDRVQLTRDRHGGGRSRRYVQLHGTPLPASDVTVVDGLLVTSLARTVLDVSCALPLRQAVIVGDAAVGRGVSPAQLTRQLALAKGRTGIGRARQTIPFLDGRSESPGESVSRVDLTELGVPPTELQYKVFDETGRFVGRTDFAWPEHRTLGEYDGRGKYGELRATDQTPGDVLWDEKEREDLLRDLGWQVVRWLWRDLRRPRDLQARLLRAFARGDRSLAL